MKLVKKILVSVILIFILAQFFRPEKNQEDITTVYSFLMETNPPKDVKLILEESCFDCHSNSTNYPWYNNITPINYWLKGHVDEGKEHLNFSEWASYSKKKKQHKFEEIAEEVEEGEMPLNSYQWMHEDANLSDNQIKAVSEWAKRMQVN